jgi:HSP20 family protein
MNLTAWRRTPHPLATLQREMNNMMQNVFGSLSDRLSFGRVVPAVDVKENDEMVTVSVELPGVDASDVELSIDGDTLEIKGRTLERDAQDGQRYHAQERGAGRFNRRIALPAEVDSEGVEASMDMGVLHLELPKLASTNGDRTIQVE